MLVTAIEQFPITIICILNSPTCQDDETIPSTDLAILFFGHKSHVSIDRKFRLICKWRRPMTCSSFCIHSKGEFPFFMAWG